MGRFEREIIGKKVRLGSQIFAVLAALGILILGLQLFSKKTGFDFFNINYSLSRLFSNDNAKIKDIRSMDTATPIQPKPSNSEFENNSMALKKAAELLQNHLTLSPIKASQGIATQQNTVDNEKFTFIKNLSLRSLINLYNPSHISYNSNVNVHNSILSHVSEARYTKWALGISINPSLAYRQLKYTEMPEIEARRCNRKQNNYYQTQKERNTNDKTLIKYSLSIDVMYRLNHRIGLQTGLVYINSGESLLLKEITKETNNLLAYAGTGAENHYFFEGTPDFEDPDHVNTDENVRFANNMSYFEIPLILNYRLRKLDDITNLEIQSGISITKLGFVNAMVYNFDNDGYYLITGSRPEVFKQYGSNALIGLVYSKYITNGLQVFANPQFKFGLTNIFNSNYTIQQHNYTAGVRLGMKINL